jgi:hypothetical protein
MPLLPMRLSADVPKFQSLYNLRGRTVAALSVNVKRRVHYSDE